MSLSKTKSLLKIGEAAKALGVSIDTLRRWEKAGKIETIRTPGGTRLYSLSSLKKVNPQAVSDFEAKSLTTEELLKRVALASEGDALEATQEQFSLATDDYELPTVPAKAASFVNKFLIGTAVLSAVTLVITSWITASYLTQPKATQEFFKNNVASGLLSPFHKLAEESVAVISPQKAQELGFVPKEEEELPPIPISDIRYPISDNVLAVTTSPQFLEINTDTQINGSLFVRDQINNLSLEGTPSASIITLSSGETVLTVSNDATLDQDVSTTSTPAFNTLNLSATSNQLVFQSGGPSGTLTWTPTAARVITLPDATTTLVGRDTTDTLKNKSISGSDNTLTAIPNSALSNSKVTVTAGTNLSGGGDVTLGSSVTLSLKTSPAISGVLSLADGTAAAPSLTFSDDADTGLYRIGTNRIGLITGGSATSGITIDGSGNLGIGNITPSATLYVSGNVGIGYTGSSVAVPGLGLAVAGSVGIGTTSPGANLDVIGTGRFSSTLSLSDGTAATPALNFINDTDTGLWRIGANQIALTTAGGAVSGLNINSSGNVGIGTTNQSASLHIQGTTDRANLRLASDPTGDVLGFIEAYGPGDFLSIRELGGKGLYLQNQESAGPTIINPSGGNIGIGTVSPTDKLIVSGGNVGIGISSPLSTLAVNGNSTIGWGLTGVAGPSNGLAVSGNVGIGVTSPAGQLDVSNSFYTNTGNITVRATDAADEGGQIDLAASSPTYNNTISVDSYQGRLRFFSNSPAKIISMSFGTTPELALEADGPTLSGKISGFGVIEGAGETDLTLQTVTSGNILLKPVGNVGIGTSAAGAALQVNGGGLFGWGTTSVAAPSNGLAVFGNVGIGTTTANSNLSVSGNAHIGSLYQGTAAPANGLFVDGNVGIGATTSSNKLDVWGNSRITGTLTVDGALTSGSTTMPSLTLTGNNAALSFTGTTPSLTSGSSVFGLFAGGNVGIGTTGNVYGGLTVRGAGTGTGITFQTYGSGLGQGLTVLDNGNVGIGNTSASQLFQINPSGTSAFVVTSGGNVGIGTTGPPYKLHIVDASDDSTEAMRITGGIGGEDFIKFERAGSRTWSINLGGSWFNIRDSTSSTQRLSIDTNGNVGLSNIAPYARLHAKGAGTTTGLSLLTTDSADTQRFAVLDNGNVGIGTTGPGSALTVIGNVGIGTSAAGAALQVNGGGLFGWGTASVAGPSNGLGIFGNVGIGTTTANSNLSVAGNAHIGSLYQGISAPANGLFVDGNVGIGATTSSNKLDVWGNSRITGTLTADGTLTTGAITAPTLTLSGNNAALSFTGTTPSLTSGSSIFGLFAQGNVGIGTTGNVYGGLTVRGAGTGTNITLQTYGSGLGQGLTVLDNGNVGIGITNPGRPLDVTFSSSTSYSATTTGGGAIIQNSSETTNSFTELVLLGKATGGNQSFATITGIVPSVDNMDLAFRTESSGTLGERMRIAAGGNVGIGYTTPTANLHVLNTASQDSFRVDDVANDTSPFVIASDGNVGIANSAPSYALDVIGSTRFSTNITQGAGQFLAPDGTASLPSYSFTNSTSTGMYSPSVNALALNTNGASTPPLTITAGGNVGIGTTAPVELLEVSGGKIQITRTGNANLLELSVNSAGEVFSFANTGDNLDIGDDTATLITLDSANNAILFPSGGNVGIGFTSPTALLYLRQTAAGDAFRVDDVANDTSPFVIASDGNVGIANSAPSYALDVIGASRFSTTVNFGGNIVPSTSDGAALGTSSLMWSDLFLASGGVINFNNGDVTITHSANTLDFAGATSGYTFDDTLTLSEGTAADTEILTLRNTRTATNNSKVHMVFRANMTGFSNITLAEIGAAIPDISAESGDLYFRTNNAGVATEWMRIKSGGSIGIGVTTPRRSFHMSTGAGGDMLLSASRTSNGEVQGLFFGNEAASDWAEAGRDLQAGIRGLREGSNDAMALTFLTRASATDASERMRIAGGGNIGIGFTSPTANLHVVNTAAQDSFRVDDVANDSSPFLIDQGGNVGIGTATPNKPLHISANPGSNTGMMRLQQTSSAAGSDVSLSFTEATGGSGASIGIDTDNSYRFTLSADAAGNLNNNTILYATTTAFNLSSGVQFQGADGNAGAPGISFSGDPDTGLWRIGANQIALTTGGAAMNGLAINSNGNVGIGTTDAGARLIVTGGNVGIGTSAAGATLQVNGGGLFGWGTTSTALSSGAIAGFNGNVGVGTTSPLGALHVVGQCVTGDTKLRRRKRKKNGEWLDEYEEVEIKDIKSGDQILTLDEASGQFIPSTIRTLMDMGIQQTYLLITNAGKQIRTTANHPYLVRESSELLKEGYVGQKEGNQNQSVSYANFDINIKNIEFLFHNELLARNAAISETIPSKTSNVNTATFFQLLSLEKLGTITTAPNQAAAKLINRSANTDNQTRPINQTLSDAKLDVKEAKWIKVSQLKAGMEVATFGDGLPDGASGVVWEKIISIKEFAREQVFDIEVENTHNFVGNDIVAHNTYLNGNVGIGATTSSNKLDVWGNSRITGTLTADGTLTTGAITAPTLTLSGNNAALSFTGTTPSLTSGSSIFGLFAQGNVGIGTTGNVYGGLTVRGAGTGTNITLQTYGSGLGQGLTVLDNGNVGIGNTGPTALAHLSSTASQDLFRVDDNGAGDTSPFVINLDGNVGIANSAPSYAMDVIGASRFSTTVNFGGNIVPSTSDGAALGTSSLMWSDLFLASGGVVNFNNGDVTITHGTDTLGIAGGNVGIGTTIPNRAGLGSAARVLTIEGQNSNNGGALEILGPNVGTGNEIGRIYFGRTAGTGPDGSVTGAAIITAESLDGNDDTGLAFFTSNAGTVARRMSINNAGNVGIANSAPSYTLDVIGTTRISSTAVFNGAFTLGDNGDTGEINTSDWDISTTGAMTGIGAITADGVLTLSANNAALSFTGTTPSLTSGSSVFGLFAGGNVGIGTTGNVYGGLTVRGAGTSTGITLQTYGSNLTQGLTVLDNGNVGIGVTAPGQMLHLFNRNADVAISFLGSETNTAITENSRIVGAGDTGTGGMLQFFTKLNGGAMGTDPRMVINNAGNVGIGFTSPTALTHLVQTAAGDAFRIDDVANDTSPFVIDQNGNVGIGTASPGRPLDVTFSSSTSYSATTTGGGAIIQNSSETTNSFTELVLLGKATGGNQSFATITGIVPSVDNMDLAFRTESSGTLGERVRITAAGNVGIGFTSPTALTHLVQTAAADAFRVDDVANDSSPFIIDQGGNVGIGTATPAVQLDISAAAVRVAGTLPSAQAQQMMQLASTYPDRTGNTYGLLMNPTIGSVTGAFYANIDMSVSVTANKTVASAYGLYIEQPTIGSGGAITTNYGLRIDTQKPTGVTTSYGIYQASANDQNYFAGNVGIGFTSPTALTHIVQTAAADAFRVDDVANDTSPFVINLDGNVGIANSAPSYALDVVGTLRSSGQTILAASSGSVGVGTASPTGFMEIDTNTTSGVALTINQDDVDQTALDLDINNTIGDIINVDWGGATTGGGGIMIGLDIDMTNLTPSSSSDTYGIRINDPAATQAGPNQFGLYVQGTNWDYGIYSEDDLYVAASITAAVNNAGIVEAMRLRNSNAGTGVGMRLYFDQGNEWFQGIEAAKVAGDPYLAFAVNSTAESWKERIRITSGGNVGIGFTSPTALTHIVQTAAADAFRIDDVANDTSPFIINLDGNVGIANSAPSYALDVVGTIRATGFRTTYDNTIVVAKSGGDYTTITDALNSITDNTSTNTYVIKVMPGIYAETVELKEYVDIEGSGWNATVIEQTDASIFNSTTANSLPSRISNLTASITAATGNRRGVFNNGNDADSGLLHINNVDIKIVTSSGDVNVGVYNTTAVYTGNTRVENSRITVSGSGTGSYGVFLGWDTITLLNNIITVSGATKSCGLGITNSISGTINSYNNTYSGSTADICTGTGSSASLTFNSYFDYYDSFNEQGTGFTINKNDYNVNHTQTALTITQAGTGASFRVNDASSDTTPFLIDTSGNVGIGYTTPTALTHIVQTAAADAFRVDDVANDSSPFVIDQSGKVFIGDTANADLTAGLTINQGANTDASFAIKNSSLAHGVTTVAETDTYFDIRPLGGTGGGTLFNSIRQTAASGQASFQLRALGPTDNTTKSASGRAVIELLANKINGTGIQNPGTDANLLAIGYTTDPNLVLIVDKEGELHLIPPSGINTVISPVGTSYLMGGNVGIGTSGPGRPLEINSAAEGQLKIVNPNNAGGELASIIFTIAGAGSYSMGNDASSGFFKISNDANGNPANNAMLTINATTAVGIADATPLYMFTVGNGDLFGVNSSGYALLPNGAAATPSLSFTGDTDSGLWRIGTDQIALTTGGGSHSGLAINSSGNVGIGNTSASQLFQINPSGVSAFVVTSGGNVGIGATSPGAQLQVQNGTAWSRLNAGDSTFAVSSSRTIKENFNLVSGSGILDKIQNVPVYTFDFIDGPTDIMGLVAEDFYTIFGRGDSSSINYQEVAMASWLGIQELYNRTQSLQSQLYVSGSGNVGIGTTSPSAAFQVNTNTSNPFVVQSGGNVGIGTTAPGAKLDVAGNLNLGGSMVDGSLSDDVQWLTVSGDIANQAVGLRVRQIDNTAGHRNIAGTYVEAPDGAGGYFNGSMHIYGSNYGVPAFRGYTNVTSDAGNGLILRSINPVAASAVVRIFAGSTGGFADERVTVLGSGNVGIGVPSPTSKLHIKDNVNGNLQLLIENTSTGASAAPILRLVNDAGTIGMFALRGSGQAKLPNYLDIDNEGSAGIVFRTAGTSKMLLDSSGNLGIGFTSPNNLFTVGATNQFQVNSSGAIAAVTGITTSGGYTQTGSSANILSGALTISANNAALSFTGTTPSLTSGSSVFGLFAGGNVGIGTTGNVYGGLTVRGAGTSTGITFQTYGSELGQGLTVLDSGNVGVGTTNPLVKLDVAGNARISGNLDLGAATIASSAGNLAVQFSSDTVAGVPTQFIIKNSLGQGLFSVDASGSARLAGTLTTEAGAFDVAEDYEVEDDTIEAGDVVSIANTSEESKPTSEVEKSSQPYDNKIIGIISTKAALRLSNKNTSGVSPGSPEVDTRPVALNGRVPVKVSLENGPIERGDYLTSSSTPGVAMKALRAGQVVGKALEPFNPTPGVCVDDTPGVGCVGKILAFVNVSFADPGNFLANLSLDVDGNLLIPKLRAGSIILDSSIASASASLTAGDGQLSLSTDPTYTSAGPNLASNSNQYIDLAGEIASIEDRLAELKARSDKQTAQIKNLQDILGNVGIATSSGQVTGDRPQLESTSSASPSATVASSLLPTASDLNLTPPDILLYTGSATLTDLTVKSEATMSGMLTAYEAQIKDNFKVLGQTILADTLVAGNLTVDGTLSIENGNSINVISTLYLQNSPLSSSIDIFNGQVTIDKDGTIKAAILVADQIKINEGKTVGSGKILAGQIEVVIENPYVEDTSLILVTPNAPLLQTLGVVERKAKTETASAYFKVKLAQPETQDINFDYLIIGVNQAAPVPISQTSSGGT